MAGRRIDDHSFWAGKGKDGVVLPDGAKHKKESGADGFGALSHYEDTAEAIKSLQMANKAKVNGHPLKAGQRN